MAAIEITQNELIEALVKANAAPAEARTVAELAELTGWTVRNVREAIGKLAMQDRIGVHAVQRMQISGTLRRVPAYTIKPAPAKRPRK